MSYPIENIAQVMEAERLGDAPAVISWLLTDSRSLSFPEETLFFALKTRRNDGVRYVEELFQRGVRNFVLASDHAQLARSLSRKGANALLVSDTLAALQRLAKHHRRQFDIPVIGITGSNGKTVVKEWLHQLLSPDGRVVRSPRSYNSQIGVPLSVWQLDEDAQVGVLEAGISQPGEMCSLHDMIRPTMGVFTHLGAAHQEHFSSMHEKCLEKAALFEGCETVVYNADDEIVKSSVARSAPSARQMAWSCKDARSPLFVSRIEKRIDATTITYCYSNLTHQYTLPFTDEASIENSLHCLAVCLCMGVAPEQIARRMQTLDPVAMRLEVKEGINGCQIINDSYNSDLTSLDIALDFLARRSETNGLKRTIILSDMLETGQEAPVLYQRVAQSLKSRRVQRIIGVGAQIKSCGDLFDGEKAFFDSTGQLLQAFARHEIDVRHEIVLIKGSRRFGFDSLSEALEKKVHETILDVNLNALVENLNHYRACLKSGTKMVCMVKASGYGAGSFEIAKTLQEHRVDYLAVAVADEGCDLRKAGITADVMVMNPELSAFKTMFDYKLESEVYSFELLDALIKAAEREGVTHFPVHIKIDTGMHRLGFAPEDIPRLVQVLKRQDAVVVRSVFSHFVGSDSCQFDGFTRHQATLFQQASQELQSAFPHKILRHICNTAGIERFPEYQFDMVRLGLGLYGINPIDNSVIHTVSTLKTKILQIHELPAGDTVGYSRRGQLQRPSRTASLPIGYADGLNRRLGNGRCYCLVNGQKAPYVGNICMDVCMIDVTDVDCRAGDEVEVFGEHLPVTVLSTALDTIPYEVLTGISTRVKRVYYQD